MIKFPPSYSWECGPGWHILIWELIEKLTPLAEDMDIKVSQIKEKFGRLAFYPDHAVSYEIYKIIHEYESKSVFACEVCGKEGTYRGDLHWKQTLCDNHYTEVKNGRKM